MVQIISGNSAGFSANDDYIVTSTGVVSSVTSIVTETGLGGISGMVSGTVTGSNTAIWLRDNDALTITQGGVVSSVGDDATYGIYAGPTGSIATVEISVAGTLYSDGIAVFGTSDLTYLQVTVAESGVIQGGSGRYDDVNGAKGKAAIMSTGTGVVINHGTIIGDGAIARGTPAAFSNAGSDLNSSSGFDEDNDSSAAFFNLGSVIGNVYLWAGNDTYSSSREATIVGSVFLGDGKDVGIGSDNEDNIFGGRGDDRILGRGGDDTNYGGGGNDTVLGGRGEDALFGGKGADEISGGRGHDELRGGDGADVFIFRGNFGSDVIYGFSRNNAEDIDLSLVAAIRNFNDLSNNHMSKQGKNTLIEDGNGNDILIKGVKPGELDAGDFIF